MWLADVLNYLLINSHTAVDCIHIRTNLLNECLDTFTVTSHAIEAGMYYLLISNCFFSTIAYASYRTQNEIVT